VRAEEASQSRSKVTTEVKSEVKDPTLRKLRSGWGTRKSEKQIPRRVAPRDDKRRKGARGENKNPTLRKRRSLLGQGKQDGASVKAKSKSRSLPRAKSILHRNFFIVFDASPFLFGYHTFI